jgi:small subunit ribosomal protein S17
MSKTLVGFVSSDKNDKTIVVRVVTNKIHPIYKKRYVSSKKYQAHDEKNEARVGDQVSIIETRPVSAHKHFKLDKIIRTAAITHKEEEPTV